MRKIISFPRKKKDFVDLKKDKKSLKLLSELEDETAILLKVKYHYKTRFDSYYFLTRHGDWFTSFDTSNYYRVPRQHLFSKDKWIKSETDDAISMVEYDNLMVTKQKYVFLHFNDAVHLSLNIDKGDVTSCFTEVEKLPIVYRFRLGDDKHMNLGDKSNKFGLIHDDQIGRYLCVLEEFYRPCKRLDRVLFALTPEMTIKALTETKLDDGITYKTFKDNTLAMRQRYLYRELTSEECDADIKERLVYEYHKSCIGLRNLIRSNEINRVKI